MKKYFINIARMIIMITCLLPVMSFAAEDSLKPALYNSPGFKLTISAVLLALIIITVLRIRKKKSDTNIPAERDTDSIVLSGASDRNNREKTELFRLKIVVKDEHFKTVTVPGSGISIGRDPMKVDVVITEPIVSKSHALFTTENNSLKIRDMGSTNGTYVNMEKITEKTISPDDTVQFGKQGIVKIHVSLKSDA